MANSQGQGWPIPENDKAERLNWIKWVNMVNSQGGDIAENCPPTRLGILQGWGAHSGLKHPWMSMANEARQPPVWPVKTPAIRNELVHKLGP